MKKKGQAGDGLPQAAHLKTGQIRKHSGFSQVLGDIFSLTKACGRKRLVNTLVVPLWLPWWPCESFHVEINLPFRIDFGQF